VTHVGVAHVGVTRVGVRLVCVRLVGVSVLRYPAVARGQSSTIRKCNVSQRRFALFEIGFKAGSHLGLPQAHGISSCFPSILLGIRIVCLPHSKN
jgi:hypothetical protein